MITNRILGFGIGALGLVADFAVQFPCSIALVVLTCLDMAKWPLLFVGLFFDVAWNQIGYIIEKKRANRKFVDNIIDKIPDDIEFINNDLTEKYLNIIREAYKGKSIGLLKKIVIVRSNKKRIFATNTSFNDVALILVKHNFSEDEFVDQVLLAHEIGHTPHCQLMVIKYNVALFSIISSVIMIVSSLCGGNILLCIAVVVINILVAVLNEVQYEPMIENNADTLALEIIETIYGPEKMHEAAGILLKGRVKAMVAVMQNLSKSGSRFFNRDYLKYRTCVQNLAKFATEDKKEQIIETEVPEEISNASLCRLAMNNVLHDLRSEKKMDTSFNITMQTNKNFLLILISVVGIVWNSVLAFGTMPYRPGWVTAALAVAVIVLLIIGFFKYNKLWKERLSLLYWTKILD